MEAWKFASALVVPTWSLPIICTVLSAEGSWDSPPTWSSYWTGAFSLWKRWKGATTATGWVFCSRAWNFSRRDWA